MPFIIGILLAPFAATSSHAQSSSLPQPWAAQDIGAPALAGSTTYSNGIYTVRAAGSDIWGKADQFQFVYQPMTGDGEIVAHVTGLVATYTWAKAGVMMRESLAAGSKHASALVTGKAGIAFQRRAATGGASTNVSGSSRLAPHWVKMVRAGSSFRAYESSDGDTWLAIGASTITMKSTIYVGLAVSSHKTTVRTTATFGSVAATASATNQLPRVSITAPAGGSTFDAPAIIDLQASASDPDGSIQKLDFYEGGSLIGTAAPGSSSYRWNDVPAGSYGITAVATDNLGARSTSAAIAITVTGAAGGVPAPWSSQDVGGPAIAGAASGSGTSFTIQGAGTDIWGTSDQFHFAHQFLTGDGEIVARVDSLAAMHDWSKAGVMLRESLAAGSPHAYMLVSARNGNAFQRRASAGATSLHTAASLVAAPYWVKLVRRGDTFEGHESIDGVRWALVGSQTIAMPQTIYAGLAVTSHNTASATTAGMSQVSVTEAATTNQPPTVTLTSPANGSTYTAPASLTLSATAADPDGTVSRVAFYRDGVFIGSDAAAPYTTTWSNVAAGTYRITAVATDDAGATATCVATSVSVTAATDKPPVVAVTSPVAGASFAAPTVVALIATASDTDGTISRVEFYAGSTLVGSDTTSPYGVNWANAAPGTYSITAAAIDNAGNRSVSTAVAVTLRPTQAMFTASADHATLVTSYRMEVFVAGVDPSRTAPVASSDAGKPAPVNGDITVDLTRALQPLPAGSYFATVTAIGAGGSSRSAPSAVFTR